MKHQKTYHLQQKVKVQIYGKNWDDDYIADQ